MELTTDHLAIQPIGEATDTAEFLPIFNSNPEFVAAAEGGKQAYTAEEIARYLHQEWRRENSHCLAIRRRDTGELIGTAALLVPNPDDGHAWLGLLILARRWQRSGLGAEALAAIERRLAADLWSELRLNVLTVNEHAYRFWLRQGYRVRERTHDQNRREVLTMTRTLRADAFLAAGAPIEIRGLKADGHVYRWWQATIEAVQTEEIVVTWPANTRFEAPTPDAVKISQLAYREYIWLDRPYNLAVGYAPGNGWQQIYADITGLPWIEDGRLCYVDHELDVGRNPGTAAYIEDEDEFEEAAVTYGYTLAFQAYCWRFTEEVRRLIDAWEPAGSFDAPPVHALGR
jgi:RimJ/RimL family protein N-acetyltransferase/protein associated with RNAse G/E